MLVLREIEAETRADRQALATMIGQVALDTVGGTAAALQGVAYEGVCL
jgi:hypothetical protein